jgi:hypothetical protein
MKRMRIVGLALVAVLAMTALAASSASAYPPEFYTKAAVGTTAPSVAFTGTLGAAFLEGKSGTKITCKAGTAVGEVVSNTKTENNVTKFTGCETSGVPCENAAAGEIDTNTLAGTLGGLNGPPSTKIGIRLFSQSGGRGAELAKFTCAGGTVAVSVKGSVIGELSGASGKTVFEAKFGTSQKLTFKESKGIQTYSKFTEGEAGTEQLESSVGGGPYEDSGQSVVATLKAGGTDNLGATL